MSHRRRLASLVLVTPLALATVTVAQDPTDADGRTEEQRAVAQHGHHHGAPPDEAAKERPAHQHRFDDAEKWAKVFDAPERDAWQMPEHVVEVAGVGPGMTVADLGAGTGYFEPYLSRAVGASGKVLALDVERDMLAFLWERIEKAGLGNVEAQLVAPDDPRLKPASVDRILIVDTWHHIESRAAYAAKLRAALKPGGSVVVVDFTRESPKGPPVEHRLTAEELAGELAAGGLVARVVEERLPYQYVVVGERPEVD